MDTILTLCDELKAVAMHHIGSSDILKIYPRMRSAFKKYSKLISLDFQLISITDADLKYVRGVHTINLCYIDYRSIGMVYDYEGEKLKRTNEQKRKLLTNKGLKYLKGVHTINLRYCKQITDDGIKYLKGVRDINLYCCDKITDQGLKYLKGVQTINLSWCQQITDKGLKYLKGVDTINIYGCYKITVQGLKYLKGVRFITLPDSEHKLEYLKGVKVIVNTIIEPTYPQERKNKRLTDLLLDKLSDNHYERIVNMIIKCIESNRC